MSDPQNDAELVEAGTPPHFVLEVHDSGTDHTSHFPTDDGTAR